MAKDKATPPRKGPYTIRRDELSQRYLSKSGNIVRFFDGLGMTKKQKIEYLANEFAQIHMNVEMTQAGISLLRDAMGDKETAPPREVCKHCGLRVYFDGSPSFPSQQKWRHHGSNLQECYITFAEPVAAECTAPAPQPDWKKEALALVVLLRAKCSEEEWANMESRFAAATPQVTPTRANRMALRCPHCNKAGANSTDAGGNELCFHCGSCGFVECEWSSPAHELFIDKADLAAKMHKETMGRLPEVREKISNEAVAYSVAKYKPALDALAGATPQVTPTDTENLCYCGNPMNWSASSGCYYPHVGCKRKFEGTSEQAPQELELEQEADGRWIAEFNRFPGVIAYGATEEEAMRNAAKVLIESEPQVTPTEKRYPNATPYTIRQEDGTWIAHAVAFDLVGTDAQKEKAIQQLRTCLIAQIAFGMKCGLGVSQCFFPAPPEYWQLPCESMPLPTDEEIAKCKFEGTSEQASPTPDRCPKCGSVAFWSSLPPCHGIEQRHSWHSSASTPKGTK